MMENFNLSVQLFLCEQYNVYMGSITNLYLEANAIYANIMYPIYVLQP